jgi:hypothetical protein
VVLGEDLQCVRGVQGAEGVTEYLLCIWWYPNESCHAEVLRQAGVWEVGAAGKACASHVHCTSYSCMFAIPLLMFMSAHTIAVVLPGIVWGRARAAWSCLGRVCDCGVVGSDCELMAGW